MLRLLSQSLEKFRFLSFLREHKEQVQVETKYVRSFFNIQAFLCTLMAELLWEGFFSRWTMAAKGRIMLLIAMNGYRRLRAPLSPIWGVNYFFFLPSKAGCLGNLFPKSQWCNIQVHQLSTEKVCTAAPLAAYKNFTAKVEMTPGGPARVLHNKECFLLSASLKAGTSLYKKAL